MADNRAKKKDEIATAREIVAKKRAYVDTEDGRFEIRKLSGLDFINFAGFLPGGQPLGVKPGMSDKEILGEFEKILQAAPGIYFRVVLERGVVRPKIIIEGEADVEKNEVHVTDLADATIAALLSAVEKKSGLRITLGSGEAERAGKFPA